MRIYVDMDGVLADFDTGYRTMFGVESSKLLDNVDWFAVRQAKGFYETLPPMPDMTVLWDYVRPHNPIVLTGVPASVEEAPRNKRAWVERHLGADVQVICCPSREKSLHACAGDILIDDWDKYRALWEGRGGIWIAHRNAAETIAELKSHGVINA
jgi:hypothetical protein